MSKVKAVLFFFAALNVGLGQARAEFSDFRALWVSRFEYQNQSPSHVQTIMANAASMGITDVIFQVRGKGDAYYNSNFEPRSEDLSGTWDPLQMALDSGHANGMKVHAWLNATPLWRNSAAPLAASHSFHNTNPSFRVFDINGIVEDPLNPGGPYASANPVLPEVHTHLNNVVNDIASNYDVDGIHLDYIRWIGPTSASQGFVPDFFELPHDAQSHQMFFDETGLDGSSFSNAAPYRTFVKDRITDMVGSIRTTVDLAEVAAGRTIELSAAVWRDPDIAENERLQDYRTWLENDLVDIMIPMIYLKASNDSLFLPNLLNTLNIPTNSRVAPGLGTFLHDENNGGVALTVTQLQRLYDNGTDGATFFSYNSFFNSGQLGVDRQNAVINFYNSIDPGGTGNVTTITDFEVDEGYFNWSPTFSGSTTANVSGSTADRTGAEAHGGGFSQLIDITYDEASGTPFLLRHLSGIGSVADPAGNLALDSTGFVGFWLKTDDAGVSVRIAVDDPSPDIDRGFEQAVIADGQWHLYEWNLDDDGQWEAWTGGADGQITGATVTLDSIQFFGSGDAMIFLDDIAHNPDGSLLPTPGDFDGDGDVDGDDLATLEGAFGQSADGDTDGDGDSDGADFLAWQANFTGPAASAAASSAVPEPTTGWLALAALVCCVSKRRR